MAWCISGRVGFTKAPCPVQDASEPMFCFETAFKLLTLSWAAYTDEEPLAGCETLCMLQKLHNGNPTGHPSEAHVVLEGECRCSHGLSSLEEVCIYITNHVVMTKGVTTAFMRCHKAADA